MKKWVKILLITLLVIFVAVAALVIWQWKNIRSIYVGINESAEEIVQRRNENQQELVSDINDYLDEDVREFTSEEKALIQEGKLKAEDVYLKIFTERMKGTESSEENISAPQNNNQESNKSGSAGSSDKVNSSGDATKNTSDKNPSTEDKPASSSKPAKKDDIVINYVTQLYELQSQYTAKAEVTINDGKNYYKTLRKTQDSTSARAATIKHFTPIVRSVESECDKKVDTLVSNLEKELKAIGENTDIARTIKDAYEEEKQLKLSYYANRYLK